MSETAPLRWRPWRSAACGWLVAVTFLVIGVPLFLRTPLWCDATLYATAARAVATGGVHYRDVFDTNPPGFVWLLCAVRGLLGTSGEALRVADLTVVTLAGAGLLWWARKAGATRAGVAWAAAAFAAFYPFTQEFNHVQRDTWMMLPVVAAAVIRLKRSEGPSSLVLAFVEGLVWGFGCWVKPHVLFIAVAAWLATRQRFRWGDHLAVFAGGVVAGLAGAAWLVASRAWPYFLDVWRTWNADYLATVFRELPFRIITQLDYFPPYSVCALVAVPLAVVNVRNPSDEPEAFYRKVLATIYLAWFATALLLQRPFHYVHVPETLLMLAVFAANRWPLPFALLLWQVVTGLLLLNPALHAAHVNATRDIRLYATFIDRHRAFDANRTRRWAECLDRYPSRETRKGVAMWAQHFGGIDPVELGAVADYLRGQNLRDGELLAWHDGPHALYLELGVKPRFRFMHVGTASGLGAWQEQQVLRELQDALPHARLVVSDLHRATAKYDELNDVDANGLPKVLPAWQGKDFPWNQPVVFRSPGGRYLVHRVANPVTSAHIPGELDEKEPPKKE